MSMDFYEFMAMDSDNYDVLSVVRDYLSPTDIDRERSSPTQLFFTLGDYNLVLSSFERGFYDLTVEDEGEVESFFSDEELIERIMEYLDI